jgi:hypothetical protein
MLGNSYAKRTDIYGGFQGNLLRRLAALFPDRCKVLHLFAGQVDLTVLPGDTLDCRSELGTTYCVTQRPVRACPWISTTLRWWTDLIQKATPSTMAHQ